MSHTVTESIYSSNTLVIPMADVQHIEKRDLGIIVVTKHTRWDHEVDHWANNIWIGKDEAPRFLRAWCDYRAELEADTLMDLSPASLAVKAEEALEEARANSQFGVGA